MAQQATKDLMQDLLQAQRFVTETYNGKATEAKSPGLKQEFLRLLEDEHRCQTLIFDALDTRGWYQTKAANQQDIDKAVVKYNDPQKLTAMDQHFANQSQTSKEEFTMHRQGYYGQNVSGQFGSQGLGQQNIWAQQQPYTQQSFQQPYAAQQGFYGQSPYAQQSFVAQQSPMYQGSYFPTGIMNQAAQTLQSNFPQLHSQVMRDMSQTQPFQPSYGQQAGFYGANQFQQQQYPQTAWQGQNLLHSYQQSNTPSYQQQGAWGGSTGMGVSGTGFGGGMMGTTISSPSAFGGGIMSSAANNLQQNQGNLRSAVMNDWSQTNPYQPSQGQQAQQSQQSQLGATQFGF